MISFLEAWENSHTTGYFQPDESAPSPSTHIRTEATGPKHRNLRTGRPEALASRPLSTAAWPAGLDRFLLSRPQFLLWEGARLEDTSPVIPIPKALGTAQHCAVCEPEGEGSRGQLLQHRHSVIFERATQTTQWGEASETSSKFPVPPNVKGGKNNEFHSK